MLFHAHPQLRDKTFKDKNTVWRPGDGSTPNTNWIRHPLPTIWNNRKYIWAQGRAWIRAEVRIDKVMITGRARIRAGVRTDNVMITEEGRSKGWLLDDHRGGRGSAQEWGLTMWSSHSWGTKIKVKYSQFCHVPWSRWSRRRFSAWTRRTTDECCTAAPGDTTNFIHINS